MGYGEILKRAFTAVKKNKWLWIWGLILLTLTGGTFSSSFNAGSNSGDSISNIIKDTSSPSSTNLKEPTVDFQKTLDLFWQTVGEHYFNLIKTIPTSTWIIIIGVIVFNILFWVLFSIFTSNWAKGGMIKLSYEAVCDREVNLPVGSTAGINYWLKLFLACFLLGLLWTGGFIVWGLFFLLNFLVLKNTILLIVMSTLTVIFLLVFILFTIYITLVQILADRFIVIDGLPTLSAVKQGLSLGLKKFFKMFGMGIINTGISCLITIILLIITIPLVLIFFGGGLASIFLLQGFALLLLPIALVLLLAFIVLSQFISAIILGFKYNTWSLIFDDVKR